MLRKNFIILCMLIFSMTLIFQVKSYTMAKVENSANMSVTSSEYALIAVKNGGLSINKSVTENITTEIISDEEKIVGHEVITEYMIADNNLEITNNTNKEINVTVSLEENEAVCLNDNRYNCEFKLSPGGFIKEIPFRLLSDTTDISDYMTIDMKVSAVWEGGSADIDDKIMLSVNNLEPRINMYEIDLRTPQTEILYEVNEDITVENAYSSKHDTEIVTDNAETDEIKDSTENNPEDKMEYIDSAIESVDSAITD